MTLSRLEKRKTVKPLVLFLLEYQVIELAWILIKAIL